MGVLFSCKIFISIVNLGLKRVALLDPLKALHSYKGLCSVCSCID